MNRINKSVSSLIVAGISILLVGGALITTLAQSGFSPTPYTPATNTVIAVPTQPANERPTFTAAVTNAPSETQQKTDTSVPTEPSQTSAANDTNQPSATSTTEVECTTPVSWIKYTVQSGDTLYSIAKLFQTTYQTLQSGNCMGWRTQIYPGETLYVPNNATITPTPKPTKAPTKTPAPSLTATQTLTPTSTATPSPTPTDTTAPTATYTFTPTNTETPTPSATP